jgi:DNA-binding transcriptional regulator of glucitol operon
MFLTPGWAGLTVVAWGAAVGMVLLGRWQLGVSDEKHFALQNFGYAFQWWAFSAFALLFWAKLIRDAWRGVEDLHQSSGGQLVKAGTGIVPVGPVELTTQPKPGAEPVVYRGYAMPQSATSPVRSHGDLMHDWYNDYLWQLSLEDSVIRPGEPGGD